MPIPLLQTAAIHAIDGRWPVAPAVHEALERGTPKSEPTRVQRCIDRLRQGLGRARSSAATIRHRAVGLQVGSDDATSIGGNREESSRIRRLVLKKNASTRGHASLIGTACGARQSNALSPGSSTSRRSACRSAATRTGRSPARAGCSRPGSRSGRARSWAVTRGTKPRRRAAPKARSSLSATRTTSASGRTSYDLVPAEQRRRSRNGPERSDHRAEHLLERPRPGYPAQLLRWTRGVLIRRPLEVARPAGTARPVSPTGRNCKFLYRSLSPRSTFRLRGVLLWAVDDAFVMAGSAPRRPALPTVEP